MDTTSRVMGRLWMALGISFLTLGGCRADPLTAEEAQAAIDESAVASQAASLVVASVEVSTEFTIGEAVERAAGEIRSFVQSQLPCAEVTLQDATLTVEYGALPGACSYRGHEFQGTHTIRVERNEASDVLVHHRWEGFTNGEVEVDGEADVTWSLSDKSRHIEHELHWTRLRDGKSGVGRGERTQTALSGGITQGIEIDGDRSWEGESGRFDLMIDHVQMRWQDPVPQAGRWELVTPFDKTVEVVFDRIDDSTIGVSVSGGRRTIELEVNKLGTVGRR